MASSSRVPIKSYSRLERAKDLARKRAISKRSGELKVADISFQGFIRRNNYAAQSDVIGLANPIGAGTARYQRIGKSIFLRSVRIRGIVESFWTNRLEDVYTQVGFVVRFALVYDSNPQGQLPNYDDIFQQLDQEGEDEVELTSSLNTNNTERFRVLREFFVCCNPPYLPVPSDPELAIIPEVRTVQVIDEYVDLHELPTVYRADEESSTTIAQVSSGALYFIRAANHDRSPNSAVWLEGCSLRLRFTG